MKHQNLTELLQRFHDVRVVVLGDVMLDRFVYGTVERISPEAPVPIIKIERTTLMPGGAANVARNIASLGGSSILIGVTGADQDAAGLASGLSAIPSIESLLIVDPSRPTICKTRYIADQQQILRIDTESKDSLSPVLQQEILAMFVASVSGADIAVLSDYAKGVLSEEVASSAISHARAAGKPVLVDPKSRSFARYRGATVITPNKNELQTAVQGECVTDDQIERGSRQLLDEGSAGEALLVTRGKDGMSIVPRDGPALHLKTAAREVYDVSGAGDTVIAALALSMGAKSSLADAAFLANIAAGIVVGKHGTATVTPSELLSAIEWTLGSNGSPKHLTRSEVAARVRRWKELGLRVGFTNGCFDLLHPGHISLLTQAKQAVDRLVVGLNSDLSVKRLKGADRPVQSEAARAIVLASLESVDAVVVFSEDNPLELIEELRPDVLVKGADYNLDTIVGADSVIRHGGRVIRATLLPNHSTTSTVKRMNEGRVG